MMSSTSEGGDTTKTPTRAWSEARLREERMWLRARLRDDVRPDVNRYSNKANDCSLGGAAVHLMKAEEHIAAALAALDRVLDSGSTVLND